jgi:hypothetical protein
LFVCLYADLTTQANYKASTKANFTTVQAYGYGVSTWTKSNRKNITYMDKIMFINWQLNTFMEFINCCNNNKLITIIMVMKKYTLIITVTNVGKVVSLLTFDHITNSVYMHEPRRLDYQNNATLSLDHSRQFPSIREGWVYAV